MQLFRGTWDGCLTESWAKIWEIQVGPTLYSRWVSRPIGETGLLQGLLACQWDTGCTDLKRPFPSALGPEMLHPGCTAADFSVEDPQPGCLSESLHSVSMGATGQLWLCTRLLPALLRVAFGLTQEQEGNGLYTLWPVVTLISCPSVQRQSEWMKNLAWEP